MKHAKVVWMLFSVILAVACAANLLGRGSQGDIGPPGDLSIFRVQPGMARDFSERLATEILGNPQRSVGDLAYWETRDNSLTLLYTNNHVNVALGTTLFSGGKPILTRGTRHDQIVAVLGPPSGQTSARSYRLYYECANLDIRFSGSALVGGTALEFRLVGKP